MTTSSKIPIATSRFTSNVLTPRWKPRSSKLLKLMINLTWNGKFWFSHRKTRSFPSWMKCLIKRSTNLSMKLLKTRVLGTNGKFSSKTARSKNCRRGSLKSSNNKLKSNLKSTLISNSLKWRMRSTNNHWLRWNSRFHRLIN